MPEDKLFHVNFKRMGKYRNYPALLQAPTVGALEKPIKEFVDKRIQKDTTITILPGPLTGQINYGLDGEFVIVPF